MATDATNQADVLNDQNQDQTKITFDERQQARVNELIREAQGRAGREARTSLEKTEADLASLRTELEEAKKTRETANTKSGKKDAETDIEELRAQIDEMKRVGVNSQSEVERIRKALNEKDSEITKTKKEAREVEKKYTLQQYVQKINPFDVDEVVRITSDQVIYDESKKMFYPVDPSTGQPRLNAAFDPMDLDEFYSEFATKKPYMVRSNAKSGASSTESSRFDLSGSGRYTMEQIFGPKSIGRDAQTLKTTNPREYANLKQKAINAGLIWGKRT